MTAIRTFFRNIADLWSLIVGLGVTGKYFTQRTLTQHYPRQVVVDEDIETYRGPIQMVGKPKTPEKPKCIACMMCMNVCPSNCFTIVKAKPPKPTPEEEQAMKEAEERGEKPKKPKAPKEPSRVVYDFSLCSLCGTCIENCPVGSLEYSHEIYWVWTDRKEAKIDLLARLKQQAGEATN